MMAIKETLLQVTVVALVALLSMLAAAPVMSEELQVDIQIIDADASPDDVVNRIQLPDFLGRAQQNQAANAAGKGKASEFNPNISGELPISNRGRSNEAREAARQKLRDRFGDEGPGGGRPNTDAPSGPPDSKPTPPKKPPVDQRPGNN